MRTELYWIDGPWRGRLAIMPRPRGGDWLEDEIRGWRSAGVDVVVSMLTGEEVTELDLGDEMRHCECAGLRFLSIPVEDRHVPTSPASVLDAVRGLETNLKNGERIAIHCRAGVGRSALLAACLLAAAGLKPENAFRDIVAARGRPVPDTEEQRQWVACFADDLLTATTF